MTGATGFLGSAVASHLVAAGWRVRGVIRPGSPRTLPRGVEQVVATLAADQLAEACHGADVVVHVAGLTKAPSLRRFREVNVAGTREVAEAARRAAARLVHVSSQAVAGPATLARPATEADPPNPITSYGVSKREAEDVVRSLPGLEWTILRPSAVYGGGDRAFLPLFRLARLGVLPLVQDPRAAYTLVHIDDVARAIELAATTGGALGAVYFIGAPAPVSAGEFLAALAHAVGRPCRPLRIPSGVVWAAGMVGECLSRLGRPQNLDISRWREMRAGGFVCSVEKAKRELGFEAEIVLADGLDRTVRWYVDRGWLKA
ncbi:MAG: NAD(P)-dependent oxidoreductase [Acidobacteria bacterium]|nr:NAD(P)-dependent oxidoreductase [Acidobacteriota bacterium]